MFGIKYESKRLHEFLGGLGFRDIEIRFFENSGNGGRPDLRSYLFARKPQAAQPKLYPVVSKLSSGWIR